jgi:heme ABC exporter ATP-binding subunit CcmA
MSGRSSVEEARPVMPVDDTSPATQILAVEVRGLKKSYGLKPILRGVDFSLPQGQRMALLGANGAGKTTILRILAGLSRPSAGTIHVTGIDLMRDAQRVRRRVGLVAHQPYLYEELTVVENLLFFARLYAVEKAQERVRELVERLGLEKRARERTGALSRGQVQRVAWARAMVHDPHLLLLDEPDTGLDQEGQRLIHDLLAEHRTRGGSVIFTTHQLEQALELSDRLVMLRHGRIAYRQESADLTLQALQEAYGEVVR